MHGKIISAKTGEGLSFANVRLLGTTIGTAANINGEFELKLSSGNYKIIASYIGFKSDTINIGLSSNIHLQIKLEPTELKLQEITVLPKENPANRIIRLAIKRKNQREKLIHDYTFNAYSKGLIKTTRDISTGDNSVGLDLGGKDTAQLKITGILENQSRGYFLQPKFYKEEIIARKQSANFPPTINTLTGGRVIQNFYTDDIQFFGRNLTSPISNDALNFYYFILEDSLAYDNKKVYQIYFEPDDKSDPGFFGRIFIVDKTYDLVKLDINLNPAANPGGIFSRINIYQQFLPFANDIYMPIDYRVFVEGNFLSLVKFGFELNSIMQDYKINTGIAEDYFDMVILRVLPDADKKDSTYWNSIQTIPNTENEITAYKRIDSLESVPKTFSDRFSFFAFRNTIDDNWSMSGPLSFYSFNPVEGHALSFSVFYNDKTEKRLSFNTDLSYGFGDKKTKWGFNSQYFWGDYRTLKTSIDIFDNTKILFGESDEYNSLTSTLTGLFGHYDFRDYYYSKGFKFNLSGEIFPILEMGIGYSNFTDKSAFVNTEFSFFNRDKKYSINQPVLDKTLRTISVNWKIDFRNFIEDGYFRRRISQGKSNVIFSGDFINSNKKILSSGLDFNIIRFNVNSRINSFRSTNVDINFNAFRSNSALPLQMLFALPGNIESAGKDFTFRTLRYAEVFADQTAIIGIKYDFNDYLFKLFNLPYIKDWQMLLSIHFNAAFADLSQKTISLNQNLFLKNPIEFKKPFYEIGFGLGQVLFPLKIEFTWKLNYFGKNNFVIGINSFVL
ncbi:MAG: hypothetical protein Fur0015_01700 [Ignavibacteriales bacterium]